MKKFFFFKLLSFLGVLIISVTSSCPFGSSLNAGTCVCLPGYTSSGSGAILVCTSLCPVGSNCVVISKRTTTATTGDEMLINLRDVELYLSATKLATSSLTFTLSTTFGVQYASKCNDGDTNTYCATDVGDRNAWLLINAGPQSFNRVIVNNRVDCCSNRIDAATLSMFNDGNVTTPAVTFNSIGSALATYTLCSTGLYASGSGSSSVCVPSTCPNATTVLKADHQLFPNPTLSYAIGASLGNTLSDVGLSSTKYPITAGSGVTYNGNSLVFDGTSNAWVSFGNAVSFGGEAFSISVRAKYTSFAQEWSRVFDFQPSTSSITGIFLTHESYSATVGFYVFNTWINQIKRESWGLNRFHHVVLTCTPPNTCQFYFDGVLENTYTVGTLTTQTYSHVAGLGKSYGNNGYLSGEIADFRLFSRALTSDEVTAIYTGNECATSVCSAGNYFSTASSSCVACPAFSTSNAGAYTCTCRNDFRQTGYGAGLVCTACPFGSSLNAGTCACLPGYTSSGSGASLVCTSLCPVGSNCVVISKRTTTATTGDNMCINLMEVTLYLGTTKLVTSSLAFSMSSMTATSQSASKCNDVDTSTTVCHTASGDRDAWLLINAGSQSFSRVIVYNRLSYPDRIDVATLSMFNGGNVTTPAVTFSTFGSSLATYKFCSTGCNGTTCVNSCLGNNYYNYLTGSCVACPPGSSSAAGAWSCTCLPGYTSSGSESSLVCTIPTSWTFSFTGNVQSFTVPPLVGILRIQAYGAQGMGSYRSTQWAGKGGYVDTNLTIGTDIVSGQTLYVFVGGQNGYNGGGSGSANSQYGGGNGGGASDVRTTQNSLTSRLVIAGGGGGTSSDCNGAPGGGLIAQSGSCCYNNCNGGAEGGTQVKGGSYNGGLGNGGAASAVTNVNGGGGGGGYYGGGGGSGNLGGGGGSSFSVKSNAFHQQGVRSGNGYVVINYEQPPASTFEFNTSTFNIYKDFLFIDDDL